jgi:hypothetical protein
MTSIHRRRLLVAACATPAFTPLAACRRRSQHELQKAVFERCLRDVQGGSTNVAGMRASRIPAPRAGLFFPGSAGVRRTMRFRFDNPLPMYPATYLWRALPLQQAGYYTAFFWGNDDGRDTQETFLWTPQRTADSYYGAHPYPDVIPLGGTHQWEVSIEQTDTVNGRVDYGRWHTQAFCVHRSLTSTHHEFYWDLPRTDDCHRVVHKARADWGRRAPPSPALTWGDAPWAPGKEVWHGALAGLQIYTDRLPMDVLLAELERPLSTQQGRNSIWYLNMEPAPGDLSDRSGRGHHPRWIGDERPKVWQP